MSDLSRDYIVPDYEPHKHHARGLVHRSMEDYPKGCYATSRAIQIPLIPREEWPERIKHLEATKSRLSDIRNRANNGEPIPSYDQNGQGFCWAYSTTSAVTLLRAVANLPYVRLSAHSVACKIKGFKDEGGWAALSMEFVCQNGVVPESLWPAKSMSRANDKPENWEAAKQYRVTEGWIDMAEAVYDRTLSFDQLATCLLLRIPVPCDRMHWAHSTCDVDLVEVDAKYPLTDARRWGVRTWNSWKDSWGENGTGVLVGKKALPDGAVCPRVVYGE